MEVLKIKEFAEVVTGGTPSTSKDEYWSNGNIPWLNSGELQQDIITSTRNYITDLGLKNSSTRLMPSDSILIALTGTTTGKVGFLTFEACANQSVTGILPSKKHFPKYLYYYLNSIRSKVMNDAYGGAQPHISQGYVKEIPVPLPPLPEQKKIASILDAADELRQKDKALVEKYNELTQALFLDMFGDPVSNPKGCKIVELNEITTKITDGVHAKPEYTEKGIPFISVKDITTGVLKFEKCKYISKEAHEKYFKRCNPENLDILYTKVGATYGRPAIVDVKDEFSLYVSVALLKPKKEIVNPFFLLEVMANPVIKRQADKAIKGIGVPDLHLNMIKKFLLPLPSMKEQLLFAERVKVIEEQKSIAQASAQKSEELFNSLLQKAFNGKLI
jgi:type I restriction enzyme S subunit